LASSKVLVKDLYDFVHTNYDPMLDFVNEIAEMPEFEELKRRMWEEKEAESRKEAEEATHKERAEIMRQEKEKAKRGKIQFALSNKRKIWYACASDNFLFVKHELCQFLEPLQSGLSIQPPIGHYLR